MDIKELRPNYDYVLAAEKFDQYEYSEKIADQFFQYNNSAKFHIYKDKNKKIILFGDVINAKNCDIDEESILNSYGTKNSWREILEESKYLAGRYILIYSSQKNIYLLPDPAATIQVSYTLDPYTKTPVVAAYAKVIADKLGFKESERSKEILNSAADLQPLHNDLTMYDEIKLVLPNYYFDFKNREAVRFFPITKQEKISYDEALEISDKYLMRLFKCLHKKHKISLPLTSGIDSRTYLAFLKEYIDDVPTYTFFHDNFNKETPDIKIPHQMSEDLGFKHYVIDDKKVPQEIITQVKKYMGSNLYLDILENSWTYYNSPLKDYYFMNGDVIAISRSYIGKNIPERLGNLKYFVAKSHNYSKESEKEVNKWLERTKAETKSSGISVFDLYTWEQRFGRFTSRGRMIYDFFNYSFNPSNCRFLFEMWVSIDRKDRVNKSLQKDLMSRHWPEILNYPFNPDAKFKFVENNSFLYYIGSLLKYKFNL